MSISMRWQIAEFIFCDQQQTLTVGNNTQQLEPMMVELLSYFCQKPDQIISKDQLIEQVWLGRIVSDNAVSKLITKLRKAFNDDARQPKFIATFPKKGYKFIAITEVIVESVTLANVDEKTPSTPQELDDEKCIAIENIQPELADNKAISQQPHIAIEPKASERFVKAAISLCILFLLCMVIYFLKSKQQDTAPVLTHAKALTAAAGNELFPSVSPDGQQLSYMSVQTDGMHLMIKNISDERVIEVSHEQEVGVGPASWSFDGTLLVYLVATPERCQYYIRTINGLKVGEAQLIHNCPAGSYGKIAFTHDNNRLVFTESEGGSSPYELFEINLLSKKIKRLTQPEVFLGGNSQFDMHPSENKILISSPDKQQWEGFYSLDLENDNLQLLFKQDAYICCGIWSHDGERVVLMGEHPAYQLISYDLKGKNLNIIYSGSRQIHRPARHSNGQDYLFTSGQQNSNVHLFDLITNKPEIVAESSMDDRLATFSHHQEPSQKKIAYISLTTGNEEVWLTDLNSSQHIKLSSFNDNRHYVDLQWSPDGQFLMALTLNEIHLIDIETGQFERLKIPQTEIRAVSFKDDKTLSFSRKRQGKWQVYYYQIYSHNVTVAEGKWQYIQFTPEKQNTLWLDQKSQLYWGEAKKKVANPQLLAPELLSGRTFNLKKRNDNWFWFNSHKNYSLMHFSTLNGNKEAQAILPINIYHFDVQGNKILFGQTTSANTDIYQTQSLRQ